MSKNAGFSLIELLVTATVLSLLISMGLASYLSFNERQSVLSEAEELKQFVLSAQSKASSGSLPSGCSELLGYEIANSGCIGEVSLCMKAWCDPSINYIISDIKFKNNLVISGKQAFFLSLWGGAKLLDGVGGQLDSLDFTLSSGNYSYKLTINKDGSIVEGTLNN